MQDAIRPSRRVICVTIKQSYSRGCLMVTQITLKTEGPHGLPSGRQTEVDPLYRGLIILAVYDCGHALQSHLREVSLVRERIDS
jgi:hypothetical protein